MTLSTHPSQDCPGGPHTYDENGNTICHIPTADMACDDFVGAGFGPEGDWEHSFFCRLCGWEYAEHSDTESEGS